MARINYPFRVGSKKLDESAIGDGKVPVYRTATGKLGYEAAGGGSGDMLQADYDTTASGDTVDKAFALDDGTHSATAEAVAHALDGTTPVPKASGLAGSLADVTMIGPARYASLTAGSAQYLTIGNDAIFKTGTGPFSIVIWARFTTAPGAGYVYPPVAFWQVSGGYHGWQIRMLPAPSAGVVQALVVQSTGALIGLGTASAYADSAWHMWALTSNGTNDHRFYRDNGVLEASSALTMKTVNGVGNPLDVGRLVDTSTYYMTGGVDQMTHWAVQLSQAEVQELFAMGQTRPNLPGHSQWANCRYWLPIGDGSDAWTWPNAIPPGWPIGPTGPTYGVYTNMIMNNLVAL